MNLTNETLIKRLTLKITSKTANEAGTGVIIYQPQLQDKAYILTAKHCLFGSDFEHDPLNSSLFLELNIGDSILKYDLHKDDEMIYFEENEPDIAIIIIDKKKLGDDFDKLPVMDVVIDRKEVSGCVISGFPNEFSLKNIKSILCSFDLTADVKKIELSPQSRIETVEFDDNLDSVQGMSGGAAFIENGGGIFFHGIVDTFGGWQRFTGTNAIAFNELLSSKSKMELTVTGLELEEDIVSAWNILDQSSKEEIERRGNRNKIGDLHIDRHELLQQVSLSFEKEKVVIVHGNAGSGKSIISAEFLESQMGSRSVFVFRADELLEGALSSFLSSKGINRSLDQILDSPILLSEKVIYVDAVENILEAQNFEAIESIFAISKRRADLKIIISIRSRYNDKLTALLATVMPESRAFVEVPLLSKIETDRVIARYDWVEKLLDNPNLAELLRTPFYLNHTISLSNIILSEGEISKRNLIIKLWQKIVVNGNNFRESAFKQIVVDRAKAMKPFVKATFIQNAVELIAAVSELLADEVVNSDEDDFGDLCYAPSHDIFQDWALIKYVNQLRHELPELSDFLNQLGSELAIRRGFRLWVSDQLELGNFQLINDGFVSASSVDWKEQVYWKDEIILSILKSEHFAQFVDSCKDQILEDKGFLFKRFTRLLLIASQPMKPFENDQRDFFIDADLENAWQVIIEFLNENHPVLDITSDWIIAFFKGWNERTVIKIIGNDENSTLNQFCMSIMTGSSGLVEGDDGYDKKVLLDTFIYSSAKENSPLEELIDNAIEFENIDRPWRMNRVDVDDPFGDYVLKEYFEEVLERMKSGLHSIGICYLFPQKVLDYLTDQWLEEDSEEESSARSRFGFQRDSKESEFGLNRRTEYKYFPASPYQTPILNLLRFYPTETIKSICKLFNITSEKYRTHKSQYRDDRIVKVKFVFDGEEKELIGSLLLWVIFRGTVQASPYLLQSILMALEKYFLGLVGNRDEVSKQALEHGLSTIYEYSTSVSPIAVVASVCMAHKEPISISKYILPLFQVKEFFYWEISRYTGESGALAPMGDSPLIQDERHESNQLPHRKEYLEGFLIRLSLTTIMFKDIVKILDKHYEERTSDSDNWSLALNRMDVRKYEIVEHHSKNQIEIKPKLDKALEATVKRYEEESSGTQASLAALNWSLSIIDKGDMSNNNYETWRQYFEVVKSDNKDALFDASAGVAFIGLKYHFESLSHQEVTECAEIIKDKASKTIEINFFGEPQISNSVVFNKEPVLLALPELFKSKVVEEDDLKAIIVYAVFGLDSDNGVDRKIFEKLAESIWAVNPDFATVIFRGLYALKEVQDLRPNIGYATPPEDREALASEYSEKISEFYEDIINSKIDVIDSSVLALDELEFLNDLLYFIPNNIALTQEQLDFFLAYSKLLQESTLKEYGRGEREDHEVVSARYAYEKKLAQILLGQPKDVVESLFYGVFDFVFDDEGKINERFNWNLFLFMDECLKMIIIEQDHKLSDDYEPFWIVWETLFNWQKERIPLFTGKLLLNIEWKDTAIKWNTITGKGDFFIKVVETFNGKPEGYLVNLAARIGFEELGIKLVPKVSQLVSENGLGNVKLIDAELWMQRLFTVKRVEIINDPTLLRNVIYLLNQMVDHGSSVALHIRDVLISYRKNSI